MNKKYLLIGAGFVLVLGFGSLDMFSQSNRSMNPKPATGSPPGNIQLPHGYIYERNLGRDSLVGAIIRKDGFTIRHDIGRMAGNYADEYFPEHFDKLRKQTHLNSAAIERQIQFLQDKIQWRRRQTAGGHDVMVVMLKESTLIASFVDSNANFIAKADSAEKIADFFLVIMTYRPNVVSNTKQ